MARSAHSRLTPQQTARLEKAALQAIPAEVSLFDEGGFFLYATPAVVRDPVLRNWLIGRSLHDWCRARGHPPSIADGRQAAIAEAGERGGIVTLEEVRKAPLGGERRFVMAFAPLLGDMGQRLGVISVGMESPAADRSGDEGRHLRAQVQSLLETEERLVREVDRLRRAGERADESTDHQSLGVGSLDGASQLLGSVQRAVAALASTDAPVLLVGEWGVPVEGVARTIHQEAGPVGPFIAVDGSSPGAENRLAACGRRPVGADGQFDGAGARGVGGTLFVDHVAGLSPEGQAHLLAILEGRREDEQPPPAALRVVAGTRRDLAMAGDTGALLPGLANRLGALPLRVPPLRHRPADVERLAGTFLAQAAGGLGRTLRALSIPEVERLQAYDWPGNESELRCVMERAAILARGERPTILLPEAGHSVRESAGPAPPSYLTEAEMERRARQNLLSVLEHAGWKIYGPDGAAALLGVRPTTLASRVKRAGLRAPDS